MAQPFSFPSFPPATVWETYVWYLIWIPFLLRLFLLTTPFLKAVDNHIDDRWWFYKKWKQMAIPGFWLLVINEVLSFLSPFIIAVGLRLVVDPLGWQSWEETPILAVAVLLVGLALWVFVDLLRVLRARRILVAASESDLKLVKLQVDSVLATRNVLRSIGLKRKLKLRLKEAKVSSESKQEIKNLELELAELQGRDDEDSEVSRGLFRSIFSIPEKAVKTGVNRGVKVGTKVGTTVGNSAANIAGAAVNKVRKGADAAADKIDARIQSEISTAIKKTNRSLLVLLFRDVAIGVAPLFAIWLVSLIPFA